MLAQASRSITVYAAIAIRRQCWRSSISRVATRADDPESDTVGAVVGEVVGEVFVRSSWRSAIGVESSTYVAMRENFAGLDRCDEEDAVERSAETIEL